MFDRSQVAGVVTIRVDNVLRSLASQTVPGFVALNAWKVALETEAVDQFETSLA